MGKITTSLLHYCITQFIIDASKEIGQLNTQVLTYNKDKLIFVIENADAIPIGPIWMAIQKPKKKKNRIGFWDVDMLEIAKNRFDPGSLSMAMFPNYEKYAANFNFWDFKYTGAPSSFPPKLNHQLRIDKYYKVIRAIYVQKQTL